MSQRKAWEGSINSEGPLIKRHNDVRNAEGTYFHYYLFSLNADLQISSAQGTPI